MKSSEPVVECADPASPPETEVQRRTDLFAHSFSQLWKDTSEALSTCGERYRPDQQKETEVRVEQMISCSVEHDESSMDNALLQIQRAKASVRNLVVRSVESKHREKIEEMLGKFSDAGDAFVREAREFDDTLSPDDIFQALRNLWIINSMQAAYDMPVCAGRSGIAYSLLYPYTDNFLDDPSVTGQDKRAFNQFLGRRLVGIEVPSATRLASTVSRLVGMIELDYPRHLYPGVYGSLLAIHRAQEMSLLQHAQDKETQPSEILDISVRKGGTSVMADAYLSKGRLTEPEAEFAFGYGVFLQFIDDLQDVGGDLSNGHQTLFTLAASDGCLDGKSNRLLRFIDRVLSADNYLSTERTGALTELVKRSCRSLVLESVALHSKLYSEQYLESLEPFSPLRFERIRALHKQMRERQKHARKVLKGGRLAQALAYA
jgi:hypothetical protein